MSSERTPCVIPGCRRTFKITDEHDEHMCGDHYRLTDKALRRLRTRIKRRLNRKWDDRLFHIDCWLWRRAKKQATERAFGI